MLNLSQHWDPELAAGAQKQTDACQGGHGIVVAVASMQTYQCWNISNNI